MATDYTQLITSQYGKLAKFTKVVEKVTVPQAQDVDVALSLPSLFDVDVAEGAQLDVIGQWVGASRLVRVPLAIFFSFDTVGLGFDEGVWKNRTDADSGVQYLDDATYRLLIKTMIKANSWDGSLWQYQEIMQTAFPDNTFFAVDNFNMTITVHVTGPTLSAIMSALLQSGELSEIRPAGVSIASYVLPP